MALDTQTLIAVGTALYGSRWQTDLAQEIEVSNRTMRRWVAKDTPIPDGVRIDLMRLCMDRLTVLEELIERLK